MAIFSDLNDDLAELGRFDSERFDRPVTVKSVCKLCHQGINEHTVERTATFHDPLAHVPHFVCPTVPKRGGHPRFYELVEEITSLHDRKNTDYASGTKEGPLGNFTRVSEIKKLYTGFDWDSPFGVAMGYMLKQLDAAFTLRSQRRQSVTGEPIRERLKDVATYSLIGMIIEEEELGKNK